MQFQEMMSLLGQQTDSPSVTTLLKSFGFDSHVKIKRSENDVHLNNYKEGVSFLFKTEEYIKAKYHTDLPNDAPVLMAIFFYGHEHEEFSEYKGDLPAELTFSNGRKVASQKLGESKEFDEDFNSEFWDFPPNIRLFLGYSDDQNSIASIQLGILWG